MPAPRMTARTAYYLSLLAKGRSPSSAGQKVNLNPVEAKRLAVQLGWPAMGHLEQMAAQVAWVLACADDLSLLTHDNPRIREGARMVRDGLQMILLERERTAA